MLSSLAEQPIIINNSKFNLIESVPDLVSPGIIATTTLTSACLAPARTTAPAATWSTRTSAPVQPDLKVSSSLNSFYHLQF